jgi:hypothetical protein
MSQSYFAPNFPGKTYPAVLWWTNYVLRQNYLPLSRIRLIVDLYGLAGCKFASNRTIRYAKLVCSFLVESAADHGSLEDVGYPYVF